MTPLKTSTPTKEDQETNSSLDSPAPKKEEQRLNLAFSPSSSETPKAMPLLIPFEAPGGSPLEPHPLSSLFPAMKDGEFAELVEDLKRNGLLTSIVVYEDKILEGRNRARGCVEAEVTPHYLKYIGSGPLEFIVSTNLHRRHLTTSQRAMIASKLATMKWGGDRTSGEQRSNSTFASSTGEEARNAPTHPDAPTQAPTEITLEKAADRMLVGRTSAVLAKKISQAAPEVAAQVEAGKISLNKAATKVGIESKAKPSKPSHSKTLSDPAPASPDTKDTEVLIPRCEEWLEAMHKDFPAFTPQQIALACSTAATRMKVPESGLGAIGPKPANNDVHVA